MKSCRITHFLLTMLLAFPLPALANAPANASQKASPLFEDPVIEARLSNLAKELRCVVCQNETLAESPAELAVDMRREIRDQMKAGMSDREVLDYLTTRYGDFVLFRPPFKPVTYLLWLGPPLFLGFGALLGYLTLKKRRAFKSAPVDRAQLAAAAQLLEDKK